MDRFNLKKLNGVGVVVASGYKNKRERTLLLEDRGNTFLRNVDNNLRDYIGS
jgi:hypothetical protein